MIIFQINIMSINEMSINIMLTSPVHILIKIKQEMI